VKKHKSNNYGMMTSPLMRIGLVELAQWERKQSHCTDKALSPPSIKVCESYIRSLLITYRYNPASFPRAEKLTTGRESHSKDYE
jgi:hypothetical protein